jgi:hypothetical protein
MRLPNHGIKREHMKNIFGAYGMKKISAALLVVVIIIGVCSCKIKSRPTSTSSSADKADSWFSSAAASAASSAIKYKSVTFTFPAHASDISGIDSDMINETFGEGVPKQFSVEMQLPCDWKTVVSQSDAMNQGSGTLINAGLFSPVMIYKDNTLIGYIGFNTFQYTEDNDSNYTLIYNELMGVVTPTSSDAIVWNSDYKQVYEDVNQCVATCQVEHNNTDSGTVVNDGILACENSLGVYIGMELDSSIITPAEQTAIANTVRFVGTVADDSPFDSAIATLNQYDFTGFAPKISNSVFKKFSVIKPSDIGSGTLSSLSTGVEINGHKYSAGMVQTKVDGQYNNGAVGFKGQFTLESKDMNGNVICNLPLNPISGGGDISFYWKNSIDFTMYDYTGNGYPVFIVRDTNIDPKIAKEYQVNTQLIFFQINQDGKITQVKTSEPLYFFDQYAPFAPPPANKQGNGFFWPQLNNQIIIYPYKVTYNEFVWKNGEFVVEGTGTVDTDNYYNNLQSMFDSNIAVETPSSSGS